MLMLSKDRHPLIFKYAKFNVDALCQTSSALRNGQHCYCDLFQVPASGSSNWTITITFHDRQEWILRSPRDDGAVTSRTTNLMLLASEAATLKYIRAHSAIPVPEVFAYSCSQSNNIGVPFILMSKARGFALREVWKTEEAPTGDLSQDHKAKIMYQLGAITWQLSELRFDCIGSLVETNGLLEMKTCLSPGLIMNERYSLDNIERGPFRSEMDFYKSMLSAFDQHVKYLPLRHHCFFAPLPVRNDYESRSSFESASAHWNDFVALGSKIDGSENRLDYVIAGHLVAEALLELVNTSWSLRQDQRFAIHHPDLSVNNIFIDQDYNITCIIDWALCSSVPLAVCLTAPGLPHSRDEVDDSLFLTFVEGFRHALLNMSRQDAAKASNLLHMVQSSRPMWLLNRFLNMDSWKDYHLMQRLWEYTNDHYGSFSEVFVTRQSLSQFKLLQHELQEDDEPAAQVRDFEKRYFRTETLRLAVSRKLTLMSQWNLRYSVAAPHGIRTQGKPFVADKKLWTWINRCMEGVDKYV